MKPLYNYSCKYDELGVQTKKKNKKYESQVFPAENTWYIIRTLLFSGT